MNKLEVSQFVLNYNFFHIFIYIYSQNKVQGRISSEYDFVIPVIIEKTLIVRTRKTLSDKFAFEHRSFFHWKIRIISRKSIY